MLDLLQAAGGDAPRRVPIDEEPPAAREPLRVLRIATEHAHRQVPPLGVAPDVLGGAYLLRGRWRQVGHLDAERGERVPHAPGRRHPCCGAEGQPHDGARAEAERQGAERP